MFLPETTLFHGLSSDGINQIEDIVKSRHNIPLIFIVFLILLALHGWECSLFRNQYGMKMESR